MSYSIDLVEADQGGGLYRTHLRMGGISVCSAPQSVKETYCDLKANLILLSTRRLKSMFFGNRPLVSLDLDADILTASVFTVTDLGRRKLVDRQDLRVVSAYLNGFADALEVFLKASSENVEELKAEVQRDLSTGVYDVYLNE